MNIYFQTKNIDIHPDAKDTMAQRLYGLNKFFSWDTNAYVDIEKTRQNHHGEDLYYVSIKIDDPHQHYFTEEYNHTIKKAFDGAYADMFRVVRSRRSKSRNLARRAGSRIKNIFKRQK